MSAQSDDDWRLTVRFASDAHAAHLFSILRTHAASALAATKLDDTVIAEHDGEWLRVYAKSNDGLRHAQEAIASAMAIEGVRAEEFTQHRTNKTGDWELIDVPPIPQSAEHRVSSHHGASVWGAEAEPDRVEIRFECLHRNDAINFAATLTAAGYTIHRRGPYLFLFVDDRKSAHTLGDKLRTKAPAGANMYYMGEGYTTVFF